MTPVPARGAEQFGPRLPRGVRGARALAHSQPTASEARTSGRCPGQESAAQAGHVPQGYVWLANVRTARRGVGARVSVQARGTLGPKESGQWSRRMRNEMLGESAME